MSAGKTILILGGTSDIGRATAKAFAARGWSVELAGRDIAAVQREAGDIAARTGSTVTTHRFDVLDTGSFAAFIEALPVLPDVVVSVIGILGDQKRAERDPDFAATIARSNYEGPALLLGAFAERLLARGHGVIVGVSSVAGDRGRASNYVYGSAKAGFTAFLSGLRNRTARKGVHVVTVKPGYVRTKMTEGMALPKALTVNPEIVGEAIYKAVEKRRDVIYVGSIWRLVMMIFRTIPESLFKKLST